MKKGIMAAILAVSMLAGCGMSADDKAKLESLRQRVTAVDTEISSMYGKVEDMHSSAQIGDDSYSKFTELGTRADDLMEKAEKTKDIDGFETEVKALESDFNAYKDELDEINNSNDASLSMDLIQVSLACEEQEKLMNRALEAGKITQEQFDEFKELKDKVDQYNIDNNLKYDDKFKESFTEIRQKLTALASAAGADNALIDRLVGSKSAAVETASEQSSGEPTAEDQTSVPEEEAEPGEKGDARPPQSEETTQAEAHAAKPLPENVSTLIDNYLALQNFALEKQKAGEITDADLAGLLKVGVELTYLKEAVEQDGVTENNTFTANDIKASLYEKAQAFGYDKAEVFK